MDSSIQQISRKPIPWIEIYPVDIAFLLLNNWRLFLSHIQVARKIGSACCRIALWDCFWECYLFCYWLLQICVVNWVKIFVPQTVPQCNSTQQRPSPHTNLPMANETIIGILRSAGTSSKLPASLKGSFAI